MENEKAINSDYDKSNQFNVFSIEIVNAIKWGTFSQSKTNRKHILATPFAILYSKFENYFEIEKHKNTENNKKRNNFKKYAELAFRVVTAMNLL